MSLIQKVNKTPLIYIINLIAFSIGLFASYFSSGGFQIYWTICILLLVVVNFVSCIILLIVALLIPGNAALLYSAKYCFISACFILLIGIPICFLPAPA